MYRGHFHYFTGPKIYYPNKAMDSSPPLKPPVTLIEKGIARMTLKETKDMREFATSLRRSVRQHSVRDKSEKRHCPSSLCHIVFVKRTRAFFQCWNNRFDGGPKWRTTARPRAAVFIHFIHPLFQVKASDRCKAQPQKRTLAVFPCPAFKGSPRQGEKGKRTIVYWQLRVHFVARQRLHWLQAPFFWGLPRR